LALEVQAYTVKKYLGAYLATLGGADMIVFTAGIGENSAGFRTKVCNNLQSLGIKIDEEKNKTGNPEREISTHDSPVKVWVIPANEEYILARDVIEIVRDKK